MKTIIDVLHCCERKRNDRTKEKGDRTVNNEQHKHILKLFIHSIDRYFNNNTFRALLAVSAHLHWVDLSKRIGHESELAWI